MRRGCGRLPICARITMPMLAPRSVLGERPRGAEPAASVAAPASDFDHLDALSNLSQGETPPAMLDDVARRSGAGLRRVPNWH